MIDLDAQPDIAVELAARVEHDAKGGLRLTPADRGRWSEILARLAGQLVRVVILRARTRRSNLQNRWYWGGIVPAVGQYLSRDRVLPLSKEQVHWLLKVAFIGAEETPLGVVPVPSRFLTTTQYADYCERIRAHAASEWALNIPGPNERP